MRIIVYGLALLLCQPVFSDDEVPDPMILIKDMVSANKTLNYDGIFIYSTGNVLNTMRIIHTVDENGPREKIISLTGNAREVIRDNEQARYYFSETNTFIIDESRLGKFVFSNLPNVIESISDFYAFETIGEGRVADLNAWIVNIRPKDKYRYGYQLCIDKQSKLLLKSVLKNQSGSSLEQIMVAQINITDDIQHELLQSDFPYKEAKLLNNIQNADTRLQQNELKWQATWRPKGFVMNQYSNQFMMTSEESVTNLVYSDGLAIVAIYIEKLTQQTYNSAEWPVQFGGFNAYVYIVDGYQITAIGEVPKITAKQIAASVRMIN